MWSWPSPSPPVIQTHPLGLAGIGLGAKHAGAVNIKHPAQGLTTSELSVKSSVVQTVLLERPWAGSHKPSHFQEWREGLATMLPGCGNRPAVSMPPCHPHSPSPARPRGQTGIPLKSPCPTFLSPHPPQLSPQELPPGPWGRGWADPAAHLELGSTLHREELKASVLPPWSPQARHSTSPTLHGAGSHPGRLP